MPSSSDPPSQNFEASIDALYQAALDRFTTERNALVSVLKKSGDRDLAARVQALAKPSITAWAVNQVWWRHRARFQAMLDAGAAQRGAHLAWAQDRTADVRAAGEARRQAVADVTDAALEVLGGKRAVGPDVQYRVAGTVEALASSGLPEGETLGRLTKDLQSTGLDALTAMADAAPPVARPTIVARGKPVAARTGNDAGLVQGPITLASARSTRPDGAAAARERRARDAAESAAHARAARLADAQARVEALTTALQGARQAAAQATAAEAAARDALDEATRRRTDLEAALDEARAAEASARRALSGATTAVSRAELDHARAVRDATRAREALETLERGS